MEDYPSHLQYSGIYRYAVRFNPKRTHVTLFSSYLNNPEVMGGAAWFGLGLISASKVVLSIAVIRHLSHWWFLRSVEKYEAIHMCDLV